MYHWSFGVARSFGKYLLGKGVIGRRALDEATQVMVVFGGRLGTILVEAGHLTLEEVETHLSGYLDRPCAPPERLAQLEPGALAAVPAELAQRYSILPMWIEKRTLHAAMLDPQDPDCIDYLAFETGLKIAPYVIAERRLVELLERHYGIRPDPRFTDWRILEIAGHCRPPGDREKPGTPEPGSAAARPDPDRLEQQAALGIAPLQDGEELSEPTEFGLQHTEGEDAAAQPIEAFIQAVPAVPAPVEASFPLVGGLRPASGPSELAQLESELALLAGREQIGELALRIATYFACSAALFAVRDTMIQGVRAAGFVRTEEIDGLYLPVDSDSLLSRVARGGARYRGRPQGSEIDATIVRHLCREEPKEIAVLPVCIDSRVIYLLYVDSGAMHLAEGADAALHVLCDTIGAAFTRLLVFSKQVHC